MTKQQRRLREINKIRCPECRKAALAHLRAEGV